jgi:hydroxymethylglutaryl-CoA reductase (NADPH)
MKSIDIPNKYLDLLQEQDKKLPYISGQTPIDHSRSYQGNIENFIGFAQVPIGLAGPLLLHGSRGKSKHWIPMATTEGALVASYNRGIKACSAAGGISAMTIANQVQRSPYFEFETLHEAMAFGKWIKSLQPIITAEVSKASRFAKLLNIEINQEGNALHITFSYETGAAAGQNMVTLVTDQILRQILEQAPHQPKVYYIEGNMSGDKKANVKSLSKIRGRKVVAEVIVPQQIIKDVLKSSAENIAKYWQTGTLGGVQMGTLGNLGHATNALTAIFIACGQDVACIAEAAVGTSRAEVNENGDLYAALTLPGLIVGVIGGGTGLPTQKEALELMNCSTPKDVNTFAEICCAVALAGELSIAAAVSEQHFTSAHKRLGRKQ